MEAIGNVRHHRPDRDRLDLSESSDMPKPRPVRVKRMSECAQTFGYPCGDPACNRGSA